MSHEAGERLQKARKAKFASAAEAARHFGVSASTYRAHENGQNAFDVDQCFAYAEELGVAPTRSLLFTSFRSSFT
jgi:DNA-binding XRE family transcriptional regulator